MVMTDPYKAYKIRDKPLSGSDSLKTGSRIIIWDHIQNIVVFAGKLTRVHKDGAIGENYVHDSLKDGKISESKPLSFAVIGIVPMRGTKETLSPRFRTYAMPIEAAPFEHRRFQVFYKIPKPQKETESQIKKDRVNRKAIKT